MGKRYYLKVFGCQMNISDSERISSYLEQSGFKSAPTIEGADLIVIVACSVRQSAIDRVFGLNRKFKKLKAKKILTGCVIKADKLKFLKFFDEVLSIDELLGKNYLELQPKHSHLTGGQANHKSAYVPIMTGCNNFCTYCVVPHTRGRETSRPAKNIIKEIRKLIKDGYKEIVLLGQNVNSYYGEQFSVITENCSPATFPVLLKTINNIPGNFTIKFLTSHPKDFSDELIDVIANSSKISKEIHLPVQSGDNKILEKMNRKYTREHYINLIKKIKNKIPEAKFTTDIIVGFPGETKKQFENTIKLFKEVNFDLAYINKYSTRQGTVAAKFEDNVPLAEKKRRWEILEKLVNQKSKLIVVLGPTASGKSDLAVQIALRPCSTAGAGQAGQAEIVSADSRQIYKGMNIGTGKITKKEMQGVPHYLLDIANPKKQFSVAEYKKLALEAINKILKKEKTPIICGGTGFYIQAITENINIPEVAPDWKLRKELEKKTTEKLFEQLKKLDPNRASNIDAKNRRRLIRALEIVIKTGKPVPELNSTESNFNVLYVGIKKSISELKKLIHTRLIKRINAGMIEEIKKLHKQGVTWKRLDDFGLEYRYVARYLQGILTKEQMIEQLEQQIINFAKRQMTWFNKYPGKKINWVKNLVRAEKLIKRFLPR
ncbi:MAG: tRNA (N6-isopentenyl adenosine(37)-C2)-methylthiotransferase MiaB [Patescibacteria group bacterium]